MIRLKYLAVLLLAIVALDACAGNPPAPSPTPTTVVQPTVKLPTPNPTSAQQTLPPGGIGLVMEYSRTGGIAGFCDQLQILADGSVIVKAACAQRETKFTSDDPRLKQAVAWVATTRTFQVHKEDNPNGPDNLVLDLKFYGHGENEPTPDQSATLNALAEDLLSAAATKVTPQTASTPSTVSSPTTVAASPGVIVFTREGNRLFARDLKTGKEWQITEAMRDYDWTQDGQHLVMVDPKESGPTGRILVLNRDRSGAHPLTEGPDDQHPRWSPDGKQIVFERSVELDDSQRWTLSAEVWVMDADGKNARKLADGFDPAWSPEGKRIAYATNPAVKGNSADFHTFKQNGIGMMNSVGANKWIPVSTLTPSQKFTEMEWTMAQARLLDQPQWSPDGTEITFRAVDGHSTYLATDARNGCIKQLVAFFFDDVARLFSYSPIGDYITIGTGGLSGFETLGIYRRGAPGADGIKPQQLIATLGLVPQKAGEVGMNVTGFDWSPDSSAIVYALSAQGNSGGFISKGVWIFDVSLSDNKQVIADGRAPVFWIR